MSSNQPKELKEPEKASPTSCAPKKSDHVRVGSACCFSTPATAKSR